MQCSPLCERLFRSTSSAAAGNAVTATEERGSYKQWSGDQMDPVMKARGCKWTPQVSYIHRRGRTCKISFSMWNCRSKSEILALVQ